MKQFYFIPQIEEKAKRNRPGYVDDLRRCATLITDLGMEFDTASPCWARLHKKYPPKTQVSVGGGVPCGAPCGQVTGGRLK